MPCFDPRQCWYSRDKNPSGKRSMVFSPALALAPDDPQQIACCQCIGCRLERSRQWALRCMHEASLHEHNMFLTLTYAPHALPDYGFLELSDFQDFMKRFREEICRHHGCKVKFSVLRTRRVKERCSGRCPKIRFFHCGEYGEQFLRPHYHALIFGYQFDDLKHWKTRLGNPVWRSDRLESLWPFGHSEIGTLCFETAAYVARYIVKKQWGPYADDHYEVLNEYGEYIQRPREYITMSRRPGIASDWIKKNINSVYPKDFVTLRGAEHRPPLYYDNAFEVADPFLFDTVKESRVLKARRNASDNTPERLAVKGLVALDNHRRNSRRSFEHE